MRNQPRARPWLLSSDLEPAPGLRTHSVASKADELIEAPAGEVVALVRGAGRGRGSRIEIDTRELVVRARGRGEGSERRQRRRICGYLETLSCRSIQAYG
jgi:hypothetical protein